LLPGGLRGSQNVPSLRLGLGGIQLNEHCGTRREFLDVSRDLHSLMGRYPHQENVCDTIGEDAPPEWMATDARRLADFKEAVRLRRQFERLAEEMA
jgi:hypothetical protein